MSSICTFPLPGRRAILPDHHCNAVSMVRRPVPHALIALHAGWLGHPQYVGMKRCRACEPYPDANSRRIPITFIVRALQVVRCPFAGSQVSGPNWGPGGNRTHSRSSTLGSSPSASVAAAATMSRVCGLACAAPVASPGTTADMSASAHRMAIARIRGWQAR